MNQLELELDTPLESKVEHPNPMIHRTKWRYMWR